MAADIAAAVAAAGIAAAVAVAGVVVGVVEIVARCMALVDTVPRVVAPDCKGFVGLCFVLPCCVRVLVMP